MKFLNALLFLFLIPFTSYADSKLELPENSINVESMFADDVKTISFVIKNKGKSDLILTSITTKLKFIKATLPDLPIKPGKQGTLSILVEPKGYKGLFKDTFKIKSNDPKQAVFEIPFTVSVKKAFVIKPAIVTFGDIPYGQTSKKSFSVSSLSGNPFKIEDLRFDVEKYSVRILAKEISSKLKYNLEVERKANVSNFKHGYFKDEIKVFPYKKNKKHKLKLMLTGYQQGELLLEKKDIFLANLEKGKSVKTSFSIKHSAKKSFKIMSAASSSDKVIVFFDKDESESHKLEISVLAGISSELIGEITLITDVPTQKAILLPFNFVFKN